MVGNDLDQAPVLVSAGKRIAIESEAGKVSQALADAVRDAAGDTIVDDPARADAIVYAGTDLRSAVGVAESLARENPRAQIGKVPGRADPRRDRRPAPAARAPARGIRHQRPRSATRTSRPPSSSISAARPTRTRGSATRRCSAC